MRRLHAFWPVALAAAASLAQPVDTSFDPAIDLDPSAAGDSPDGDTRVRTWLLAGDELRVDDGFARFCTPFGEVGEGPEGDSPGGIEFGPDGSWFVVAHRESRNLLVYDAATRALIREIALSGSPVDLALSPDGAWAVTANLFEDTASIVDLDAGLEAATVPVGEAPITCRVTPDGTRALVGTTVGDDLSIIDVATATELHRVPGLSFGMVLSANFESWAVAFACSNPLEIAADSVAVFPDTLNDRIGFVDIGAGTISFIATDDAPRSVAISADGATAVVTHAFGNDDTLAVVDLASRSISKTIDAGADLRGPIALSLDATKAVVAVSNAVRVVNLETDAVSGSLNTASVNVLRTTADGEHALCVGFRGSLISFATESLVKNLNNVISTSLGEVSPTDHRAVLLATTFGEDMVVVNTDGASGFLEEVRPSGPPPEGDKPRTVAVTPDGSRVLTTNQFSRNVSVFDRAMTQLAMVDVGARPGQVRITPDGSKAVVTNRDSTFVSVIDIDSLTSSDVTISSRGDQTAISPDGTYAYVAVVTSDGVWRVNLDTLSVEGPKLPTGEMGGVGYTGNQFSGLALSPDGATLIACNSFDDTVTIIDTGAWSVVATVGVGDFPTAASFSPDLARIYVTNRNDDSVSVVTNDGAGSQNVGTAGVGDYPYHSAVSDDGSTLYVLNTIDDTVGVVDTVSLVMTDTIALDDTPIGLVLDGDRLLVGIGGASASTNGDTTQTGQLAVIDTLSNSVVESICADHFLSEIAADASRSLVTAAGLGGESAAFFDLDPCPPDLNGDGVVDTRDFIEFLGLWSARDPRADWNSDGVIDTRDFIAYLGDWSGSC